MDQFDMKQKLYLNLPLLVKTTLIYSEGWLVGGAIPDIIDGKTPKDFDIIVPDREKFMGAVAYMNTTTQEKLINTFGGHKFRIFKQLDFTENIEVDLWCEELSHFILNATKCPYAYNMRRSKLIKVV